MTPLVSIIIPCFNAAPYVAATLESALEQSWRQLEVIVVDDGSTDESLRVIRRFEGDRVRVLPRKNGGAASARNAGLQAARGEYIQFLDADDLLSRDKIAAQLAAVADKKDHLASCRWGRFTGDPASARFTDTVLWRDFEPSDFVMTKLEHRSMMHPAAWLTPRALIDAAGRWNERLTVDDDGEFFARVTLRSTGIVFSAGGATYYRSSLRGSLSQRRNEAAWKSQLLSIQLTCDHLLMHRSDPRAKRAAADALQLACYEAYPFARDERAELEAKVAQLGGSDVRYSAGPRFEQLRRIFGWAVAKRLRNRFG